MKTVDVRVLLNDEVDPEYFVEQLVEVSRGPGAPLGAVELLAGRSGPAVPSHHVFTNSSITWDGSAVDES